MNRKLIDSYSRQPRKIIERRSSEDSISVTQVRSVIFPFLNVPLRSEFKLSFEEEMKNEDIFIRSKNLSLEIIFRKGRKMKILFEKSLFPSCRKKKTDIKETFIFVLKKKREGNFYSKKGIRDKTKTR